MRGTLPRLLVLVLLGLCLAVPPLAVPSGLSAGPPVPALEGNDAPEDAAALTVAAAPEDRQLAAGPPLHEPARRLSGFTRAPLRPPTARA